MDSIIQGFSQAFWLIVSGDRELCRIILLSLGVSGGALALAALLGLPVAALTGLKRFPLRGAVVSLLQTGMGLPPVVVGLLLYMLLSRQGPLGFLELLYTPGAMILAQTILALPIVASLAGAAIMGVDPAVKQAAVTLGATPRQQSFTVIREAGYGIMAAIIAAAGRVMAEVGAVLMVGGNIAGYTRVMTTTIALETDKGNFELAIALGVILLALSLVISLLLRVVQQWGKTEAALIPWP
ncbi:MAG: ABC transporter permease subunit [Deltaproteobacteria bacterium]|nr:ABC transporter permease subunit [Deltaproteobacteria bacterium]